MDNIGAEKLLVTAAALLGATFFLCQGRRRQAARKLTVVHCSLSRSALGIKKKMAEFEANKSAWEDVATPDFVSVKSVFDFEWLRMQMGSYDCAFTRVDPAACWPLASTNAAVTWAKEPLKGVANFWRSEWALLESKALDYSDRSSQTSVVTLFKRSCGAGSIGDYVLLASTSLKHTAGQFVRVKEAGEMKLASVVGTDGNQCTVRLTGCGRTIQVPSAGVEEWGFPSQLDAFLRFCSAEIDRVSSKLGLSAKEKSQLPLIVCIDSTESFSPVDINMTPIRSASGIELTSTPSSDGGEREDHIFYNSNAFDAPQAPTQLSTQATLEFRI